MVYNVKEILKLTGNETQEELIKQTIKFFSELPRFNRRYKNEQITKLFEFCIYSYYFEEVSFEADITEKNIEINIKLEDKSKHKIKLKTINNKFKILNGTNKNSVVNLEELTNIIIQLKNKGVNK